MSLEEDIAALRVSTDTSIQKHLIDRVLYALDEAEDVIEFYAKGLSVDDGETGFYAGRRARAWLEKIGVKK